ncbi:MAG TPA: sugar phosphate isomerase/epimerase family protein [Terriglobales bacterium]|nr:sugar phosphate isomerase/epimerase family protein [Terriglobales bacterium]
MITRRTLLAGIAAAALSARAWGRARAVKVGVCTRDIASATKYGFDYIEPAAAEIAAMSEGQFRQYADTVLASPLRCHSFNSLIRRPDLKVVGEAVPASALKDYLQACLPRCRHLGASVVVWGSAGSRNVPEGFTRERAQQQIADFLHMAGEIARPHDLIVAIEPLRRQESNILNTGAEALEMVRKVKHPNVRMIIDYYHMRQENEDPRILEVAKREIVHLHFANPRGRLWPHDLSEDDHYETFFRYLKKTGYSGGISIEGQGSFEKDGTASLEFFRRALN